MTTTINPLLLDIRAAERAAERAASVASVARAPGAVDQRAREGGLARAVRLALPLGGLR